MEHMFLVGILLDGASLRDASVQMVVHDGARHDTCVQKRVLCCIASSSLREEDVP